LPCRPAPPRHSGSVWRKPRKAEGMIKQARAEGGLQARAAFSVSARSVFSQLKAPLARGSRPKWP